MIDGRAPVLDDLRILCQLDLIVLRPSLRASEHFFQFPHHRCYLPACRKTPGIPSGYSAASASLGGSATSSSSTCERMANGGSAGLRRSLATSDVAMGGMHIVNI